MLWGFATVYYWADDLEAAKEWYSELLGIEPYIGCPGYYEFRVGDYGQELGLIDSRYAPASSAPGAGGALLYWHVPGITPLLVGLFYPGCVPAALAESVFPEEPWPLWAAVLVLWTALWFALVGTGGL